MVARTGGYFGVPIKGQCVVTQGDPLYPKIYNVVVYTVPRHWVSVLAEEDVEAVTDGFGRYVQRMAAYFYADDGILASAMGPRRWAPGGVISIDGLSGDGVWVIWYCR